VLAGSKGGEWKWEGAERGGKDKTEGLEGGVGYMRANGKAQHQQTFPTSAAVGEEAPKTKAGGTGAFKHRSEQETIKTSTSKGKRAWGFGGKSENDGSRSHSRKEAKGTAGDDACLLHRNWGRLTKIRGGINAEKGLGGMKEGKSSETARGEKSCSAIMGARGDVPKIVLLKPLRRGGRVHWESVGI